MLKKKKTVSLLYALFLVRKSVICDLTATSDLLSFVLLDSLSFPIPAKSDLSLEDLISYFTTIKADQLQVTICKITNKRR